jgi:hypothetical protein
MLKKLKIIWQATAGFLVMTTGIIALGVAILAWPSWTPMNQEQGVTFAWPHARGIGLDWQKAYLAILDDLDVKHLRLSAYWNELEPEEDKYDFRALDWQMDEAEKHGAKVVLAVGRKVPRWPECHVPEWATPLDEEAQQEKVLDMVELVVRRYESHPALEMWQMENEPVLDFGVCPPFDRAFYEKELALVRRLSDKPVLVTDSGELNWWLDVSQYGDTVGTTMYRTVHSQRTDELFHYDYIFPAWLYRAKARLVKLVRGKDVLIAELQGEPWAKVPFTQVPDDERERNLSVERLEEVHDFAVRTQLPRAYWWGVEFWYWEREVKGNPGYWDAARAFFE